MHKVQMKDPHWVSFSPSFHWTDQKLRVHASYCVQALTLTSLLQRKAAQAGIKLTIPALLKQLSDVKEIINIYPAADKTSSRGRPRMQYVLSERTALQDKLCQLFGVYTLAHPQRPGSIRQCIRVLTLSRDAYKLQLQGFRGNLWSF